MRAEAAAPKVPLEPGSVTVDLRPLLEVFYDEAAEHLTDFETLLLSLDTRGPDSEAIELMFRAARSAKLSSITLGLADVTELAHQLECLLDRLRQKQLLVTLEVRDAGLDAALVLRALLAAHRGMGAVESACTERALRRLQALGGRRGTGAAAPGPWRGPAFPEAADAAVLPVGWRGQGRRGPGPLADASAARPTGTTVTCATTARRPEPLGRAGAGGRKKP